MLADAAQILQQAVPSPKVVQQAVPISTVPTPGSQGQAAAAAVTQGTPVTMEALNAQIDSLRAMAREHEVRMIGLVAERPPVEEEASAQVKALLDSGATHAVVPYSHEMGNLERVGVTLAGDSKEEWFKTHGGTLGIPPPIGEAAATKPQTILPFGTLVYSLLWVMQDLYHQPYPNTRNLKPPTPNPKMVAEHLQESFWELRNPFLKELLLRPKTGICLCF